MIENNQHKITVRTSAVSNINQNNRPILPLVVQNYHPSEQQRRDIEDRVGFRANQIINPTATVYQNNIDNMTNLNAKLPAKHNDLSNNILTSCPVWVYIIIGSLLFISICFALGLSAINNAQQRHNLETIGDSRDIKYTVLTEKCQNGLFLHKGRCIECPNNFMNKKGQCIMRDIPTKKLHYYMDEPKSHYSVQPQNMNHYKQYDPSHEGFFSAVRGAGRGIYGGASSVARGARRVSSGIWGGAQRLTRSII